MENSIFCAVSMMELSCENSPCKTIVNTGSFVPRRTPIQENTFVFSCKFTAYFQNTFYQEYLWVAASDYQSY